VKPEILRARGTGKAAIDEVRAHPERDRATAAANVGVSEPMIAWARRIVRFGVVELVDAVESGEVALYMGARVANWPPTQQLAFLRLARTGGAGCTLTVRCAPSLGANDDRRVG
jgi:hypothetical protein